MSDSVDSRPPSGQPVDDAGVNHGPAHFGLTSATALIIGTIVGVGIFNLPTSLAGYGPISLVSMALTTVGALALAVLFAALSRRLPADGGPYAYARAAFGNRVGFRPCCSGVSPARTVAPPPRLIFPMSLDPGNAGHEFVIRTRLQPQQLGKT